MKKYSHLVAVTFLTVLLLFDFTYCYAEVLNAEEYLAWHIETELKDDVAIDYVVIDSWIFDDLYESLPDKFIIPSFIDGKPVWKISAHAFMFGPKIELPEGLKYIESEALGEVGSSIRIPASVEYIGEGQFSQFFDGGHEVYVEVDDKNKHYKSIDGMLLTKDGSELLYCSGASVKDNILAIPDGVKTIRSGSINQSMLSQDGQDDPPSIIIPDGVTLIEDDAIVGYSVYVSINRLVIPQSVEYIGQCDFPDFYGREVVFEGFPVDSIPSWVVSNFERVYFCYNERQDVFFDTGLPNDDPFELCCTFAELIKKGEIDEALAIQNLDGKHPSDPSGSGNSVPSAEPQIPASPNTTEPLGQLTNDPSTPGTQVDPQAPDDLGEAPVSSVNSGSAESPEEPAVTRNIAPAIAAAMILAAVGIVLIRKRK